MRIIENQNFKEQNYSYNLANRRFRGDQIGEYDSITQHEYDREGIIDFNQWMDEGGGSGGKWDKPQKKSIFDKAKDKYEYGMGKQKQLDEFGFNNENIINTYIEKEKEEDDKFNPSRININNIEENNEEIIDTRNKKNKSKKGKGKRGNRVWNPNTGEYQSRPLTEEDYSSIDPNYKGPMPGVGQRHNQTGNWTEEINEQPQESFLERLARYGRYAGYVNSASKLGYLAYNTYRVIRNHP